MGPDEYGLTSKDGEILTLKPGKGLVFESGTGEIDSISTFEDILAAIKRSFADAVADDIKKTDEVSPQPQPKKGIRGISILDFFERYRIEPRYQAFKSRPRKADITGSHTWMVIYDKKEGKYLREEDNPRKYKFFIDTDEILDFLKEKAKKQEEDK